MSGGLFYDSKPHLLYLPRYFVFRAVPGLSGTANTCDLRKIYNSSEVRNKSDKNRNGAYYNAQTILQKEKKVNVGRDSPNARTPDGVSRPVLGQGTVGAGHGAAAGDTWWRGMVLVPESWEYSVVCIRCLLDIYQI